MAAINLASKYEKKVDERFNLKELTNYGLNKDYNWEGVDTIKVYNIDTVPLNDYQKTGTSRYGTPDELGDNVKEYKLTTDKSFTFTIDEFYKRSQQGTKQAGKALAREIDEVIVPEKDKQRLKIWATTAGETGQEIAIALSKSNAYESFLDMQALLDNALVPLVNRVFYINTKYYKYIKLDPAFIKASDIAQKMLIKGQIGEIDGIPVKKCPDAYFSEGVNGILVYTKSTLSPAKLTEYKIHDNPPGINGDLVEGRVMFDTFVLEAKKKGIAVMKNAV